MGKHTKRVEIRPGVTVNLRPEDRKAYEKAERPATPDVESAAVQPTENASLPRPKARKA